MSSMVNKEMTSCAVALETMLSMGARAMMPFSEKTEVTLYPAGWGMIACTAAEVEIQSPVTRVQMSSCSVPEK